MPAVAVDHHQALDAPPAERPADVVDDGGQGAGADADGAGGQPLVLAPEPMAEELIRFFFLISPAPRLTGLEQPPGAGQRHQAVRLRRRRYPRPPPGSRSTKLVALQGQVVGHTVQRRPGRNSAGCAWSSAALPSRSVNKKVTVP